MPSAATVTSLLAIAACLAGTAVAFGMWEQRRRAARARRLRHPSSPPPVSIVIDEPTRRWRIEVAADAPPTAVDIVSWRPATSSPRPSPAWTIEPIVEPIEIGPGGWALTSSEPPPAASYDVSLAWTSHSDAGELQGSRTLRVDGRPRPRGTLPAVAPARSPLGWPLIEMALAAVLLGALVVVAVLWASDDAAETSEGPTPTTAPPAPSTPATSLPGTVAATEPPVTTPADTTPTPSSPDATTDVTTDVTTGATSGATTTASSTSPTTSTTATTVPGPSIEIVASIDACRAGPECLVASFTIDGFEGTPTTYICEFADGERIEFGFGGDSVTRACATGSADASITIEIDGVRSDTVTRDDAG